MLRGRQRDALPLPFAEPRGSSSVDYRTDGLMKCHRRNQRRDDARGRLVPGTSTLRIDSNVDESGTKLEICMQRRSKCGGSSEPAHETDKIIVDPYHTPYSSFFEQ